MGKKIILTLILVVAVGTFSGGTAFAGPDNFGGEGGAWTQDPDNIGVDYYEHKNTDEHTKNFDSSQGAGTRFSQPGAAEGKADGNSVIRNDPIHPGTQVLPGSNR